MLPPNCQSTARKLLSALSYILLTWPFDISEKQKERSYNGYEFLSEEQFLDYRKRKYSLNMKQMDLILIKESWRNSLTL